jgi:hypothetical protein
MYRCAIGSTDVQRSAVTIMSAPSFYEHRKEEREDRMWGVTTQGISYIDMIDKEGPWLVGGSITVLGREALL